MIDFKDLPARTSPVVYDMDVLKPGQIGGKCKLIPSALEGDFGRFSTLQNWSPEITNFEELKETPSKFNCDRIVKKPTIIMKIDARMNSLFHIIWS